MDSASFQFVLFGLTVAVISNLRSSPGWRSGVLLISSLVFLGLLSPHLVPLLPIAAFLALTFVGLLWLEKDHLRALPLIVALTIFAYIWLKKYSLVPDHLFLTFPYFTLGLSYIFFRVLHLLIDSGADTDRPRVTPMRFLLYNLNFTTLISGPIQRYEDFTRDQLENLLPLGRAIVAEQIRRIIAGLFKVNVVGVILLALQQDALISLGQATSLQEKLFAGFIVGVTYPFFLYANFSGYIDIIIALARLMRLRLPENFNRPFSACSFIDFWNRWHITLSLWLKTYVYNPLLLALMRRNSRVGLEPYLGVFCFFATFFLVGLWHGRTSEFICFGLLQGGGVAVNKLWQIWLAKALGRKEYKALTNNSVYRAIARGLTFTWFAFTLNWFWASWQQIHSLFQPLSISQWLLIWLLVWAIATIVLEGWERVRARLWAPAVNGAPVLDHRYARVVFTTAQAMAALLFVVLMNQPAPGIVYKAF